MEGRLWLLSGSVLLEREGPEEVFITYDDIPGDELSRKIARDFRRMVATKPLEFTGFSAPCQEVCHCRSSRAGSAQTLYPRTGRLSSYNSCPAPSPPSNSPSWR